MGYERAIDRDCAIVRAWIRRQVTGAGTVPPYKRDNEIQDDTGWSSERGAHIYSYGRHFTIAEVWKPRGRRPLIILNGDRWRGWRSRTDDHQSAARAVAGELAAAGAADVLIIPLAALDAAGIDHSTMRPLQQLDDVWIEHERPIGFDLDDLASAHGCEPFAGRHGYGNAGLVLTWRDDAAGRIYTRRLYRGREHSEAIAGENWERHRWTELAATAPARWIADGAGWLDDSVSSSNLRGRGGGELQRREGVWLETWREHRLGECLFTARAGRVKRRRRFVSSFDYQERAPLYFLAELPASLTARTVAAAIEDLAPRAVHAAMARGLAVYRQGDMFAIQTALTDAEIYGRAVTRARLAPFRGNGRIRRGELGYLAPARRRALIEARYLELRGVCGRAGKPVAPARAPQTKFRPAPAYMVDSAAKETAKRAAAAIEARRYNRAAGRIRQATARDAMREAIRASIPHEARYAAGLTGVSARLADVPADWQTAVLSAYGALRAPQDPPRPRPRYPELDSYSPLRRLAEYPAQELQRIQTARRGRRLAARAIEARPTASDCYFRAVLDVQTMDRARHAAALTFYGTAHTATEVVKGRGGITYARGRISHATELESILDNGRAGFSREPDHAPVRMADGRSWFLIVRNTVPRAR